MYNTAFIHVYTLRDKARVSYRFICVVFLIAVGRKGCLSVILGQLTRCEKSFVPAKKFVVEREREEIETQDSFSGSIRQKCPTRVRYKRRDWAEQRKRI